MSSNDIKIGINVSDGGTTAKANKEAQKLHGTLKDVAKAASEVRVPTPVAAARMGVEASNATKGYTKPISRNAAAPNNYREESESYGVARGIAGTTGAASRDFAKQAQGLGGLVHVYATFAANLFAVSAAFSALSKAADTTNMIKGLDQLSIGSGRALGNLSKQLSAVTDGAISMRDAMTATVSASAGGMTNAAILRMGNVAKQASQALGVAMPDALNRISRGITKLEPELLDEIGIMVRVDKTSQDYARTLGKTASALTDFEKRQGFANAVLEQGEKKFGAIKIDANPYAKILASMENIAQTGLELVNKVLNPMLTILSSSPMALATAMGLVASVLLKQALPAIGSFKESMAQAAEQAKQLALTKASEAGKGYALEYAAKQESLHKESKLVKEAAIARAKESARITIANADAAAERSVETLVGMEKKITEMQGKGIGKGFAKILAKNLDEITDKDILKMQSSADASNTKKDFEAYKQQILAIESVKKAREAHTAFESKSDEAKRISLEETANITKAMHTADKNYAESAAKIDADSQIYAANALRNQKGISQAKMTQVAADRALTSSTLQSISAQAVAATTTKGFGVAMREAYASVKELRQGKAYLEEFNEATGTTTKTVVQSGNLMTGSWTLVKSAIGGATSAIGNALNFMGPWIAVIGIAIAAIAAFADWMSTAGKEIDKFNSSLDTIKDSTKLLKDVAVDLWSKGSEDWLTADSLVARANAMVGLTDSIAATISNLKKVQLASSGWDNFWDGFLWTDSRTQKASKAIGTGISEALKLMPDSEAKKAYEVKIGSILGKSGLGVKNLPKLDVSKEILEELAAADKAFSTSQANTAEAAAGGKKALDELDKAYNTLKVSMMPSDNLTKFGLGLLNVSTAMRALSKDTENAFQELLRLSKDPAMSSQFSIGPALITYSKTLEEINNQYNTQAKSLKVLREEEAKSVGVKVVNPRRATTMAAATSISTQAAIRTEALYVNKTSNAAEIKALEDSQIKLFEQKKAFTSLITNLELDSLNKGLKAIGEGFSNIIQGAQLKLQGAIASTLVGEAGIKERERIALKEIDLRLASNTLTSRLILSQDRASLHMEALGVQLAISAEEVKKEQFIKSGDTEATRLASEQIKKLSDSLATLNIAKGILSGSSTFANYSKAAKGTDLEKDAAERVKNSAVAAGNMEAQAAAASLEKVAIKVKGSLDIITEVTRKNSKAISDTITSLDNDIKALGGANTVSTTMYFENLIQQKEAAKISQQELLIEEKRLGIQKKRDALTKAAESTGQKSAVDSAMKEEEEAFNAETKLQRQGIEANRKTNAIQVEARQYAIDILNITREQNNTELLASANISKLDTSKTLLENSKTLGLILEETYIKEKAVLDIKSAQATKIQEINALETTRKLALIESSRTTGAAITGIGDTLQGKEKEDAITQLKAQQVVTEGLINEKATVGKLIAESKLDTLTKTISQQSAYNSLIATQAEQMNKMVSVTESLSTIFGELGTAIGGVGQSILRMAQDDETYLSKKILLEEKATKAAKDYASAKDLGNDEGADKAYKDKRDAEKGLIKLDKDKALNEISNIGKVAGASKKMFKEKTGAYKILDGIEKASAAYKMAIQVKELAVDLKNFGIKIGLITAETSADVAGTGIKTAAELAGEATTLPAKIAGAIASLFSSSGWVAFGLVGAMLALIGSGGGGSTVNTTGLTAEDQQKSQGTGQKWVDGKLVDTGGGVFGDSEAKSNSIQNSLDMIANSSVESLKYTDRSLSILESINTGIDDLAISLYKTVGVVTGSGFGTSEGSSSDPGILGLFASSSSTEIINSGIKIGGTLGAAVVEQFEGVLKKSSSSGIFGLFSSSSEELINNVKKLEPEATGTFQKVFNSMKELFVEQGASLGISAKTITDSLAVIPIEAQASLKGLKGKELREELGYVLSSIQDDLATKLFPGLLKFQKMGEGFAETVSRINVEGKSLRVAFENIGISLTKVTETALGVSTELLTAQSLAKTKVTTLEQDLISKLLMQSYTYGGDTEQTGYSEIQDPTIISALASARTELAAADRAVLAATGSLTSVNTDLEQALIKAFGGSQKYQESLNFFTENFKSEAEVMLATSKRVSTAMLGISNTDSYVSALFKTFSEGKNSIVDTKSEFEKVMNAALEAASGTDALAKSAALDLIPQLVAVQQDFLKVAEAAEAAAEKTEGLEISLLIAQGKKAEALVLTRRKELKELTSTDAALQKRIWLLEDEKALVTASNSQQIAILNLLNKSEEALAITRANEMEALDELLRPAQLYLYALQDQEAIKTKLTAAYTKENTALKTTLSTLSASIKTLGDYRTTLLADDKSISTPAEKYQESKRQAEQVAAIAKGIAVTDSEILAKQEAINKLPSVTGTFLEASKGLYASSEQYTQDFNSVLALLDSTGASLISQKTDAEKQLATLDNSYNALGFIEKNTATTAELISQYLAAASVTETARVATQAPGSFASRKIPAFANGGLASGISLVGEKGAELVDFKTPTRVYSNTSSNQLLNNKELIQEIKNLRKEVSELRSEQKEQTGHLIKSNYDANARAATKVVEATEEATNKTNWRARSAVKVA